MAIKICVLYFMMVIEKIFTAHSFQASLCIGRGYDPTSPSFDAELAEKKFLWRIGRWRFFINRSGLRPECAESGPESRIDAFCLSSSPDKQKNVPLCPM